MPDVAGLSPSVGSVAFDACDNDFCAHSESDAAGPPTIATDCSSMSFPSTVP